jgi:uncharacterized surface protein with fasciclin (FAS1) repeats
MDTWEDSMIRFWTGMAAGVAMVAAAAVGAAPAQAQGSAYGEKTMKDIVAVAQEAGQFGTLLAAVEAAGLVDALKGEGPFTVFAPTDEAFAKLPAGTVEALLQDRERLVAVLMYHVVPGRVMSADVIRAGGGQAQTLQGDRLTIRVDGDRVQVDGATVVAADVSASNGVIHVIDAVVLPGVTVQP